ncbi:MAG: hypothetical protein RI573_01830 [Balneolaceae bacterium]|nr:hypothetical protein [Balneolaceae bacterium]
MTAPQIIIPVGQAITPSSHRLIGDGSGPWIFRYLACGLGCQNHRHVLPLLRDAP